MKTRTNLFASLIMLSCGLLAACSDPTPDPNPAFPNYVAAYIKASDKLVYPNNRVVLNGKIAKIEITPILNPFEQDKTLMHEDIYTRGSLFNDKKFKAIAEQNGDTGFNRNLVPPNVFAYLQPNTRVDVTCDKDYAAGYLAGTSLNALFRIRAWNIKAFIDGGYDTRNPQLWGPTVSWGGTPEITDGVLAPETTLTNWNATTHPLFPTQCLLLSNVLPDVAGEYSFTVTFTFDDGATASFTTEPVALTANVE